MNTCLHHIAFYLRVLSSRFRVSKESLFAELYPHRFADLLCGNVLPIESVEWKHEAKNFLAQAGNKAQLDK